MRRVAVEFAHTPVPFLPGKQAKRITHSGVVLVHLLGVARTQFVNDLCSDRYNHAALVECVEQQQGLLTVFSMN
jgi:hypothetical protein